MTRKGCVCAVSALCPNLWSQPLICTMNNKSDLFEGQISMSSGKKEALGGRMDYKDKYPLDFPGHFQNHHDCFSFPCGENDRWILLLDSRLRRAAFHSTMDIAFFFFFSSSHLPCFNFSHSLFLGIFTRPQGKSKGLYYSSPQPAGPMSAGLTLSLHFKEWLESIFSWSFGR